MVLDELIQELAVTRSRYEDLRIAGGDFEERAVLRNKLHELRARVAAARVGGI